MRDIATALEDLDGRVVHRDLKPENVLYFNGEWCLADFGISRYAEASTAEDTRKFAMTPQYAAPEQWRWEHATSAADTYALGVMGYELLTGTWPFPGPDYRDQHLHAIPPTLQGASSRLASLVTQCLPKHPASRPSARDVLRRLDSVDGPPPRPGLERLQAANEQELKQLAESQSRASQAESARERHARLFEDARRSLAKPHRARA